MSITVSKVRWGEKILLTSGKSTTGPLEFLQANSKLSPASLLSGPNPVLHIIFRTDTLRKLVILAAEVADAFDPVEEQGSRNVALNLKADGFVISREKTMIRGLKEINLPESKIQNFDVRRTIWNNQITFSRWERRCYWTSSINVAYCQQSIRAFEYKLGELTQFFSKLYFLHWSKRILISIMIISLTLLLLF